MVVAMEECAEVQQALSKAIRFGADNHHPNEPETTNGYQVLKEFHQLRAVMDMIVSRGYIPNIPDEEVENVIRKENNCKMKIFDIFKHEYRDKTDIFRNANASFDFDYTICSGTDSINRDAICTDNFANAVTNIDASIVHTLAEADYYA